jgi:ribosomal protein L37AE/L43A
VCEVTSTISEEIYESESVKKLLERMLSDGVYQIIPKLSEKGFSYPILDELFPEKSPLQTSEFLESLVQGGVMKAKLLDRLISCAACGSTMIRSRYNCPRCDSLDVERVSFVEHVKCGYVDSRKRFLRPDGMFCPKCKNPVVESDYRKIGSSFECNSCRYRFENPKISHTCEACQDVFTYRDARYEPIYEYTLTEQAKTAVVKGTIPLQAIKTTLGDFGFEVQLRGTVVGKSGATHTFDVVARKPDFLIVANISFEPKEEDVIALFAKKYDIDPKITMLLALSQPSKEVASVGKAYGVSLVTASKVAEMAQQIQSLLKSVGESVNLSFQ